jgi:tryptophan synthase alpha subunit
MEHAMQAITHIADTFTATRAAGRAALMPYFTLGFPDPATSLDILEAIAHSGPI